MGLTAFKTDLTVTIDLDDWAYDYDVPNAVAARDDVRLAVAKVAEDWLINQVGYRSATVRVRSVDA